MFDDPQGTIEHFLWGKFVNCNAYSGRLCPLQLAVSPAGAGSPPGSRHVLSGIVKQEDEPWTGHR